MGTIPRKITSRFSRCTAHQRTNIQSLFCLKGLICSRYYEKWFDFVQACIICSRVISIDRLQIADRYLPAFLSKFVHLDGPLNCTQVQAILYNLYCTVYSTGYTRIVNKCWNVWLMFLDLLCNCIERSISHLTLAIISAYGSVGVKKQRGKINLLILENEFKSKCCVMVVYKNVIYTKIDKYVVIIYHHCFVNFRIRLFNLVCISLQ